MLDSGLGRGLRVLLTADAVGGVFSYTMSLCEELARHGVDVVVACMGPRPSHDQRQRAGSIPRLKLLESDFALEWTDEPWHDVDRAGHWLLALAREFQPDLVHLNGYCHASLDWKVPTVVVAHSCVVSWWRATLGGDPPERYQEYRARVGRALPDAGAVVAPTESMLKQLREAHGYFGPAQVVYNGAPVTEYYARPKRPFFLCAGRLWDRAKNTELVIECAARLPWPVHLVGAGTLPRNVGGVSHLGLMKADALARLMGEAAVFLHPARYEPFGLAPLEAALSGAALVLGKLPSLEEIWGDTAFYVSPDDPAELVRVASRLADDPVLRHSQARRAEARARGLSSALMGKRYLALYTGLLQGGRSARRTSELAGGVVAASDATQVQG